MWDSLGHTFMDGIGQLTAAGFDRVANEVKTPNPKAQETAQPATTPVKNNVGVNSDGTTVHKPVPVYNAQSTQAAPGLIAGVSNTKLLLAGGAIAVLLVALVMGRR